MHRALESLRREWGELWRASPGARFTAHYNRHGGLKHSRPLTQCLAMSGAVLLGLVGLVLSIPPGVLGIVVLVQALAIMAAHVRGVALGLDRAEVFLRRVLGRFRRPSPR